MTRRIDATVRGVVQGVSFRWYTRQRATDLGLSGWVRNEPDGSVRVVAEGDDEAVAALLAWLAVGPPSALVEAVEAADVPVTDDASRTSTGFEITR